jgi:hypothetical protein
MTCRNFRRSVAAQLGYCGLDRERRPLHGDEIRACWESSAAQPEAPEVTGTQPARTQSDRAGERTPVRRLEFVEVQATPVRSRRSMAPAVRTRGPGVAGAAAGIVPGAVPGSGPGAGRAVDSEDRVGAPAAAIAPTEPRWSLWGDTDT